MGKQLWYIKSTENVQTKKKGILNLCMCVSVCTWRTHRENKGVSHWPICFMCVDCVDKKEFEIRPENIKY